MKKIISIILAALMIATVVVSFTSCGPTDWEKVQKDGKIVCGITIYEPMNFKDENGNLVGFDTEFAKLVGEKLGVEIEFQEIKWGNKYVELNAGNIDCIWNGFTSNSKDDDGVERSEKVDFSYAYADNKQCIVVKQENLASITSAASLQGKNGAAEAGSAGEAYAKSVTTTVTGKTAQMDTFPEVKSGAVDFAVVDVLLAQNIVGQGNYSDLAIVSFDVIDIAPEVYSIGCRKGSDLDEKINEAIIELLNEGKLEELAAKYTKYNDDGSVKMAVRLTDSLLAMKTK